jgi:hypothetical protein
MLRVQETHGQEGKVTGDILLAACYFDKLGGPAIVGEFPFQVDDAQCFEISLSIADELFCGDGPLPFDAFFV